MKRILAKFRPRDSGTIFRFERSTLSEEGAEKHKWIRNTDSCFAGKEKRSVAGITFRTIAQLKTVTTFKIRFAERPQYPRHNRKIPKE